MDRIGSYEVLGLLGEGGMGAVYRGRDPRFDREVAIKVLHDQFRRDPGVVERFKSEAVIQAKLNHPHIVSVLDFVADDVHLAIVMEHVEGPPLDEVIRAAEGPLPVDRAVRLMDQVLSAMAFAHKRGLVHRDIKPSNILVQHLEGQEYAKVTDFGIAKILGSEKVRTATGAKMGTLAYMSPEHVQSPKGVDARSDVYSLGVVLYEMLTGRVPFDADSEYGLMRAIVEQPAPRVRAGSRGASEAVVAVVDRALAKEPTQRFQDCEAMQQALGEARVRVPLVHLPVSADSAASVPARSGRVPASGRRFSTRDDRQARSSTTAAPRSLVWGGPCCFWPLLSGSRSASGECFPRRPVRRGRLSPRRPPWRRLQPPRPSRRRRRAARPRPSRWPRPRPRPTRRSRACWERISSPLSRETPIRAVGAGTRSWHLRGRSRVRNRA
ncbi:MAG: serine/threonine protein kinase [Vicinamibacteria bacterium]|nr:serine/threonine protein kinase [Vicinamibacteria bacterium]